MAGQTKVSAAAQPTILSQPSRCVDGDFFVESADETQFIATIVVVTKNRKDDLRNALQSCLDQEGDFEILVVDDGSSDGTSEMVRQHFPGVRLDTQTECQGLVVQRNRAATLARGKYIFSIDDDAEFSSADVVANTIAEFEECPIAGVIAIPCIDVNDSPDVRQPKPEGGGRFATSTYIGTAHAIRRDLFIKLGGYRAELFHQGEECDLTIRMLEEGYVVLLGSAAPILHYESPRRSRFRMDFYGRRNDVLFVWHNVPSRRFLIHFLGTIFNGIKFGLKVRRPIVMLRGSLCGVRSMFERRFKRDPVSIETYQAFRQMRRKEFVPLSAIANRLTNSSGEKRP